MITNLLLSGSKANVYVCSLSNERGLGSGEQRLSTRDPAAIARFIKHQDKPGRGLFFCVSTIEGRRTKENTRDSVFLHSDIDFKNVVEKPAVIKRRLARLPMPPSIIHASGNGLHCFWLFNKPSRAGSRIEESLKALADIVAGDRMVTHRAALLRLPGSHNSKNGSWRKVRVITNSRRKYSLDRLERWLQAAEPVLQSKTNPVNFFVRVSEQQAFSPPIDVGQRLNDMTYQGEGERAIHNTQLSVSASMLNSGEYTVEEVVDEIMLATKQAAGSAGRRWNWDSEERAIRKMCVTWLKKKQREAGSGGYN